MRFKLHCKLHANKGQKQMTVNRDQLNEWNFEVKFLSNIIEYNSGTLVWKKNDLSYLPNFQVSAILERNYSPVEHILIFISHKNLTFQALPNELS